MRYYCQNCDPPTEVNEGMEHCPKCLEKMDWGDPILLRFAKNHPGYSFADPGTSPLWPIKKNLRLM